MSTQTAPSIHFTHAFPQQGFRLLELSSELLELLSSDNPPTLFLKSPSDAYQTTRTLGASTCEYVNLCTPTKTFRLRQVQSSNSIHIIRPGNDFQLSNENTLDEAEDRIGLTETMTAIAKCGSTLELHVPAEGFPTVPFFESSLRLYDKLNSDEDDLEIGEPTATSSLFEKRRVKDVIFNDVPVSISQCECTWVELCAFVAWDHGSNRMIAYRPSERQKLDVWKRILEGSVLHDIDLEKQFQLKHLWNSILDEGEAEPFPWELFKAVVKRLMEPSGMDEPQLFDPELEWANIDKTSCIRWVGEMYLHVNAPTAAFATGKVEFLHVWKDHLPESWRSEASLSKLTQGSYKYRDSTTLYFVSESGRQMDGISGGNTSSLKQSRNWHERFRSERR